ncbi:L-lactate permease, partial [Acinetobacter baumannii]
EPSAYSFGEILKAWSPFLVLTVLVTIWTLKPFKALFAPGGELYWLVFNFAIPHLDQLVVKGAPIATSATPIAAVFKFDPISATGQVAGGANMICFTTGRGSAYGCAPAPSLKLATNTALWQRQEEDMDINCGEIADSNVTPQEVGERFFQMILDTASGKKTKSELHGYG